MRLPVTAFTTIPLRIVADKFLINSIHWCAAISGRANSTGETIALPSDRSLVANFNDFESRYLPNLCFLYFLGSIINDTRLRMRMCRNLPKKILSDHSNMTAGHQTSTRG
jgi:hypothetical protein